MEKLLLNINGESLQRLQHRNRLREEMCEAVFKLKDELHLEHAYLKRVADEAQEASISPTLRHCVIDLGFYFL